MGRPSRPVEVDATVEIGSEPGLGLTGALLDENGVGACMMDPEDRIVAWNESYLRVFPEYRDQIRAGWPYVDSVRHFFDVNGQALDPAQREEHVRLAVERHRTMVDPTVFQKVDGRWLRTQIHRLPHGGCVKMWTDVSGRFATDEGMATLSDMLGAVDMGVLQYGPKLGFQFANRNAAQLLPRLIGLFTARSSYQDHLAVIAREEVDPREAPRFDVLIERRSVAEQPIRTPMVIRRRDGGWLRLHEQVAYDGSVSAIFTDVTEMKRMEDANDILAHQARALGELTRELGAARDAAIKERERAEDASRAKSRFLATMTHELRTPLNAILGFSEIMRDERFGPIGQPRYGSYAGMIHDAGRHLLSLINDILDLSKIEAGRRDLHRKSIDIRGVIDDCLLLIRERLAVRSIDTAVTISAGCEHLLADERATKQILVNLLTNAAKFTPTNGTINIAAEADPDGGLWLSVADNGLGMTAAQVRRALQPFGQVEDPLVRHQEGTGLGLPIVKALAEAHGGRLVLESQPSKGTRAAVLFPQRRS
jgi:signal transduction histidine kinase